jgi:hypothetical protein
LEIEAGIWKIRIKLCKLLIRRSRAVQLINEEKGKLLEHVVYEFRMVLSLPFLLRNLVEETGGKNEICSAILEAFLVHVRCLIYFLFSREAPKIHPDDPLAKDFFEKNIWFETLKTKKLMVSATSLMRDWHPIRVRINDEVAHIVS